MPQLKIKYEKKSLDVEFQDRLHGKAHLQCIPHIHRELELVCMIEGEAIAYADSIHETLRAGDVYLSFPNQIHFYRSYTREKYLLFIIKPDLIPELVDIFKTGVPSSPIVRGFANEPYVKELFFLLADSCSKNKSDSHIETVRRGVLLALLSKLLPRMTINLLSVGDSDSLHAIVSFCSQNFSSNISLSTLEEHLHLNKYYISHLFRDKLGIGFNEYIHSLRITEACKLLVNSNLNITEISEQVGFNTSRTFNRSFIKQMGISPSQYRKQKPS